MAVTKEFEDVETNLLFNLLRMSEILMSDIDRRFQLKGARFSQSKKRTYGMFMDNIRKALDWFDKTMEGDYWEGAKGKSCTFDKMRFEANELIQLLLLYIDRVSLKGENYLKIFEYIQSLESCNIVSEENLQWFQKIPLPLKKGLSE